VGRKFWAILAKDIQLEIRGKETWVTMVAFAMMVALLFGIAVNPLRVHLERVFPGVLWVSYLFAGMLGIGRGFEHEARDDALVGLLVAPGDRLAIFLAKLAVAFLYMFTMELVLLPIFLVLLGQGVAGALWLVVVTLALGTAGFVGVGTLFAAVAANTRSGSVLLPVLLVPFGVPVLILATQATGGILNAFTPPVSPWPWLHALMAYDAVFLGLPLVLYEFIWEG
jgi:heme exporter protein B